MTLRACLPSTHVYLQLSIKKFIKLIKLLSFIDLCYSYSIHIENTSLVTYMINSNIYDVNLKYTNLMLLEIRYFLALVFATPTGENTHLYKHIYS